MNNNKLEVGDTVIFEGSEYVIDTINGDDTIRLKSDDKTHENYSGGSIGCYHMTMVEKVNK